MANVIRYKTSQPTKRGLRKGNTVVGNGHEGYGPTSTTGYVNGITPPDGGYVVYTLSSNNDPAIYVAESDNDLPAIARTLGGGELTPLDAKNYIAGLTHAWVINSVPNNTITNGLVLDLNAKNISSFLDNQPTTNYGPSDFGNWGTEASAERIATGTNYKGQPTYNCRTVVGQSWRGVEKTISGLRTAAGTGGTVTMSCMVRNNNGTAYNMYAYIGHDFGSTRLIPANSDWIKVEWTVNQSSMNNDYVEFRPYTNNANVYLEMTMPMVEVNVDSASDFVSGSRLQNTIWKDISGNGYDVTLVNQPTFNKAGYISFDGVNQRGDQSGLPTVDLTTDYYTIEVVCRFPNLPAGAIDSGGGQGGPIYGARQGSDYILFAYAASSNTSALGVSYDDSRNNGNHATNKTISAGEWVRFTHVGIPYYDGSYWRGKFKYYVNGVLDHDETVSADSNGYAIPTTFYLAYDARYGDYGEIDIASIKRYSRELTAEEVSTNYYGGNIVTDGLVLALDASNLVSYESGSTIAYSLTGSVYSGSLTNGVSFSNNNGGIWDFDGSDDFISIPTYTFGNGNWTLSMWVNVDNFSKAYFMSNSSGGPVTNVFGALTSKIFYQNYDGTWKTHYGNTTLSTGEWYLLTWVNYSNNEMEMYVDGVLDSSRFNSYTTNGGPCNIIGGYYSSTKFDGKIANMFIQTKALTPDEVLQNYNAQKARFGL